MKTSPQSLIFPLNVYAELLELAFGEVDYLSYGVQSRSDGSVRDGQQAMAEQLAAMISAPPGACVLDVGCGTGALAQKLARTGYQVTAIDVNEQAVGAAQQRFANMALSRGPESDGKAGDTNGDASGDRTGAGNIPVLFTADLQTFAPDQNFDVLVLQNSARYLSPLAVFAHARRLLKPGGQLLIQEEFTGDDTERHPEPLPVLKHVLDMATRAGYVLTQQRDLSPGVAEWMQLCLELFDQNLHGLEERTGLPIPQLLDLRQAMAEDRDKCRRGRYCHVLLDFHMGAADVTLLPAGCLPVDRYRALFENSFDTDFSPALWQWKYGNGRGHSVVACKNDMAVAHYGGISRDILYFGKPERALQICDVMVMPQHRGFYSRRGLFFSTAASMLELYAGNAAGHQLGFGFPNIKAMHVAQRLGLYAKTDELLALSYLADSFESTSFESTSFESTSASDTWTVTASGPDASSAALINVVWPRMVSAFSDGIIGLRDWAYLSYRYAQRPGLKYDFLALANASGDKAMAVIRDHGECSLIMDIVAADDDLATVLWALCRHGHDTGRPMVFWLSAGQLQRVQTAALQTEPTGIHIPCNAWTEGPSAPTLQGKWWLTAGDMDFL
ncbi:MAG: GNAT family N-acetyltransferase [Pseudohongiella sp.]|uniref:GNAT family N-acetyltransferase n=1 Tax=Pseudohongiella sp. TaxID=1979412 RepID=UPI0034A01517